MIMNATAFVTDPALMALFATFAAGLTQIVKTQFKLTDPLHIQGIAILAFAAGIVLHFTLPDVWGVAFDLVAGGTGVTGTIGLAKEFKPKNPDVPPSEQK